MNRIYFIISMALLVLAAASAAALFIKAVWSRSNSKEEEGKYGTLWGLLIIGLALGLTLLKIAI